MVKKITVIPVHDNPEDETIQPEDTTLNEEDTITINEDTIKLEDDTTREKDEINTQEQLEVKPTTKEKKKILNTLPTTEKVISQVQCQACGKSMSAKNLKYSHAGYCIKRVEDVEKSKAIPKKVMKNLMKLKPVKVVQQDEESDDDENKIFKGSIIPSENDKEFNTMTKLKNKIIKAQESDNNSIELSEFNNMEIKRLEALKISTYEVRMKNAREKKQEKYDKLTSKAF